MHPAIVGGARWTGTPKPAVGTGQARYRRARPADRREPPRDGETPRGAGSSTRPGGGLPRRAPRSSSGASGGDS
jgi:hypothetical protein